MFGGIAVRHTLISAAMHRSLKDLHRHQLHHTPPQHITQHCPEDIQKKLDETGLKPPLVITLNRLPPSISDSQRFPVLLEHRQTSLLLPLCLRFVGSDHPI
ncbi:hypothetical protein BLNAU_19118 [Blattamonas nauphoetae]|uniref:Uncharacterized protein n=1 Tax=Blattamonas nauphoetae TaxID=2049346 RepID=A0ABQ9X2G9_9EUKA|nr:hypothetical protein BLNAU_19118 [Blattamonas nauphoetae]